MEKIKKYDQYFESNSNNKRYLVRFKNGDDSFTTYIAAVTSIEGNVFKTTCLGLVGGKGLGSKYYTAIRDENRTQTTIVTMKIPFQIFEKTSNPNECDLLAITYYMGTDYENIVKTLGNNEFIIDDKVPIFDRITDDNKDVLLNPDGRYNDILEYTAFEHLPKEHPNDGDMNTRIQLSDKCKYEMYKFIK